MAVMRSAPITSARAGCRYGGLDFQLGSPCTTETEAQACQRIKDLVRYVETLQQR